MKSKLLLFALCILSSLVKKANAQPNPYLTANIFIYCPASDTALFYSNPTSCMSFLNRQFRATSMACINTNGGHGIGGYMSDCANCGGVYFEFVLSNYYSIYSGAVCSDSNLTYLGYNNTNRLEIAAYKVINDTTNSLLLRTWGDTDDSYSPNCTINIIEATSTYISGTFTASDQGYRGPWDCGNAFIDFPYSSITNGTFKAYYSSSELYFYNSIPLNPSPLLSQPLLLDSSSTNDVVKTPFKICADGSKATMFKFATTTANLHHVRFSMKSQAQISDTAITGVFNANDSSISANGDTLTWWFTHPTYLTSANTYNEDTLLIIDTFSNDTLFSNPIQIYRAPTLFVHGLAANRGTFKNMTDSLITGTGNLYPRSNYVSRSIESPLLWRADYSRFNTSSFIVNSNTVREGIDQIFTNCRANKYSAGKVIMIGHSMGGILGRLYLQDPFSYLGDFQKLICLNTVHYGTQVANYLLSPQSSPTLMSIFQNLLAGHILSNSTTFGAIQDLQVNSIPITLGLNVPTIIQNKVPSVTLSTDQTGDNNPFTISGASAILLRAFLSPAINGLHIYHGETHDLVVPMSSQKCGITIEPTLIGQQHLFSANNDSNINRIKALINSDPLGPNFTRNGFPDSTLTYPVANPNNSSNRRTTADSIHITSPTTGQIFNPGNNVTVNITYSGNITHMLLGVIGSSISPITIDTANVNQLSFQIPNSALGTLNLFLLGGDSTNWYATDTVSIYVASTVVPDSIMCSPPQINLPLGLTQFIDVQGFFSGSGTPISLTGAGNLTMQYDTTMLYYMGNNTFQGILLGTTTVIFNYLGATDSAVFTIFNDPSALTAAFSYSTNQICSGDSIHFFDQSQGLIIGYHWNFPGGLPSSSTQANPYVAYPSSGVYTVSLKTTFVNGVDSILIDSLIYVNQPVAHITSSGATTFCQGDSVTLTSDTASSYLWSTGDSTQSITVTTGNTYYLTIINANGCTSVATQVVTVNPLPNPAITGITTICQGDTTTLDAGSGYSNYLWSTTATTQTITTTMAGSYTVTVTNGNGCTGSATSTIIVNPSPNPVITGITTICQGDTTTLDAGSGYSNYLWSTTATTQTITTAMAGSYSVTVTNGNGCSGSATSTIIVNPLPNPVITGITTICEGDTTTLDAGSGYTNYLWSTTATTQTITTTMAGSYTVTVTNGNGCTGSATSAIIVNPLPNPVVTGITTICQGDTTTLDAGSGYSNYLWSTTATTQIIAVSTAGSYTVTITDINGCSAISPSIIVNVNPLPTPTITGNTTFCAGDSTTLDAGSGYSNYLWSTTATTQTITASTAGSYTVTVTDANGCNGLTTSIITVNPLPTATITPNGSDLITSCFTLGCHYQWYLNVNPICTDSTVCANSGDGSYSVTITDTNGCSSTSAPFLITGINENNNLSSISVYPNPAHNNITVAIENSPFLSATLNIYNSFGENIYSENIKNTSRDFVKQIHLDIAEGIYFVQVSDGEKTFAQKLIIQ